MMENEERLYELIHQKELGDWSEAEQSELETLLKSSSELRQLYLKITRDSMSLHWVAHERGDEVIEEIKALREKKKDKKITEVSTWRRSAGLAWAAALLMACGLAFLLYERYLYNFELEDHSIAVLTRSVGAVWDNPSQRYEQNAAIDPGVIKLKKGLVQIDFYSGASVVLEGPAEFELINSDKAFLSYGKLRSYVPDQAKGFTVGIKDADVVDLGTEFALQVDPDGNRQLHVIDGEVKLQSKDRAPGDDGELLTAGKAIHMQSAGEHESIPVNEEAFVDFESLYKLSDQKHRFRYDQWDLYSQKMSNDPSTLLYFSFEGQNSWDREIVNRAENEVANGAIVGCRWSEGRWPGKKALEFKGVADRVRVDVPGKFRQLSYSAWIRLDGLSKSFSAIFLTDTWGKSDMHWQISSQGQMVMGIHTHRDYRSDINLLPPTGEWRLLTSVYNLDEKYLKHYINGKLIYEKTLMRDNEVNIGLASIGNWMNSEGEPIGRRNLNGRIDELVLLKRALSQPEIREMYRVGRPD